MVSSSFPAGSLESVSYPKWGIQYLYIYIYIGWGGKENQDPFSSRQLKSKVSQHYYMMYSSCPPN